MNNNTKKTIMIATGGTGGHIFPALSIMNEIKVHDFVIITDQRGKNFFNVFLNQQNNSHKIFIHKASSPSVHSFLNKIKSIYQFIISFFKSIILILKTKPKIIIGFGGYFSVAPILAAKLFKIPIIIHEQNAIVGRANKFLSNLVNVIALSFVETKNIKKNPTYIFTGNPTRKEFNNNDKSLYKIPRKNQKFNILVVGGSLGSKFFSHEVTKVFCSLPKRLKDKLKIVQQVRSEDKNFVEAMYNKNKINYELKSFFENIPEKFFQSHLIITRSGGSSVAEILTSCRPVIFIPLPSALDNHQEANAKFLEATGGAWTLKEDEFVSKKLKELLENLLTSPIQLIYASKKIKSCSNSLESLRKNQSPAQFLSNIALSLINSDITKPFKLC